MNDSVPNYSMTSKSDAKFGAGATKKKKMAHEALERLQENAQHQGEKVVDQLKDVQHRLVEDAEHIKEAVVGSPLSLYAVSHLEKLSQKKGANKAEERFKVVPSYAYPNCKMNREELRNEMNLKSSYFHSFESSSTTDHDQSKPVGTLYVEILQCFGLPKTELLGEASSFCVAVVGDCAFQTDVMPPVANPMWLRRMRRAAQFPLPTAYARLYVGVLGRDTVDRGDAFAGRIAVDVSRLRPGSTYDVTLPLRQSAHVYARQQRGAIRLRLHLEWHSERQALLSYWPSNFRQVRVEPNEQTRVRCCDSKSFQNVARVVHGAHPPGRFTLRQLKATVREINFTRIHVLRYMRKREVYNLTTWQYPLISGFVFIAWMHSVYMGTLTYAPGHFLTLLWLYLIKNYVAYCVESPVVKDGFLPPTWEEMCAALVSSSRRSSGGKNCIEPLEMERKNEADAKSALQDMNPLKTTDESVALLTVVADAFRNSVPVRTMRYRFHWYQNVFLGKDAVSFLVHGGYACTRMDAVALGGRLMKELHLFEHVNGQHVFKDEPLFYTFLTLDSSKYTFKTHEPRGTWLFRIMGLSPSALSSMTASQAHMEMPFADGVGHPRFTVRDTLVIRSKESKLIFEQEKRMMMNSDMEESVEQNLDAFLEVGDSQEIVGGEGEFASAEYIDNTMELKVLKKPPQQDMDVMNKGDKKIVDVLAEVRHKLHGFTLHCFNDRVYKISDPVETDEINPTLAGDSNSPTNTSSKNKNKAEMSRSPTVRHGSPETKSGSKRAKAGRKRSRKDEYDRLLGVDKYSHGNPWIAKLGLVVQPIIEIALEWLCLFRALFNIFTWQDPMLSFWFSIALPVIAVALHLFPWRIVLGAVGLVMFGPQNWILRLLRERRPDYEPPDFDKITKTKKTKTPASSDDDNVDEARLFSSFVPDNRQLCNTDLDASNVREIVVPYSPLMYQRFYDWPPENEYARVVAEGPPPRVDPSSDWQELTPSSSSSNLDSTSTAKEQKGRMKRSAKKIVSVMRFRSKIT